jgi:hypothetical protein
MRAQHVGKQLRLPRVEADPCASVWPLTGGMNSRVDHSRGRTASEAQLLRGHQGLWIDDAYSEHCKARRK